MRKALLYGIAASFFFAFSFIFNRSMNLSGGYWLWNACLRYIFTLPMMVIPLLRGSGLKEVHDDIGQQPVTWLVWSVVGFVLFYAPLSLSSAYGESWLIAASWQITIVAGVLLTPLFGQKLPLKNLGMGFIILMGIFLMQFQPSDEIQSKNTLPVLVPVLIGAFAYPLGNRKMMSHCKNRLTSLQRVYGMTLCSMPAWLILSLVSYARAGIPKTDQVVQSVFVALLSGVLATILFFKATDMVKDNPKQLALIEATQSGEVIFTLVGGFLLLDDRLPSAIGYAGIVLILMGMLFNSLIAAR